MLERWVARSPCTLVVWAPFEMTFQSAGVVTAMSYVALRSGWSKQANTRLASAVSNWE